jgi:hypothetical protein
VTPSVGGHSHEDHRVRAQPERQVDGLGASRQPRGGVEDLSDRYPEDLPRYPEDLPRCPLVPPLPVAPARRVVDRIERVGSIHTDVPWLRPSVLVAIRHRRVLLLGETARIDVELDAEPSIASRVTLGPLSVTDLVENLGLEQYSRDAGELRDALEAPGWTTLQGTEPSGGHLDGVTPLAVALALHRMGRPVTRRLVLTADEALWTGADAVLAGLALLLFTARLSADDRGHVYRASIDSSDVSVQGDLPVGYELSLLPAGARTCERPRSYALPEGTTTGFLDDPGSALTPAAGRLSVVGAVQINSVALDTAGKLIRVTAIAAEPPRAADTFADPPGEPTWVMGSALDLATAAAICCSEAAEYWVSSASLGGKATFATAETLGSGWLSPEEVISYSAEHRFRLKVHTFDPAEPQWWLPGTRAGLATWIPMGLVATPPSPTPSWWHWSSLNSSGVAAHPILNRAIDNAWSELVERDAFQRFRAIAHSAPPAILNSRTLPDVEDRIHSVLAEQAEVVILHLQSPTGLPVVLVRADSYDGGLALGLGVDPDPSRPCARP